MPILRKGKSHRAEYGLIEAVNLSYRSWLGTSLRQRPSFYVSIVSLFAGWGSQLESETFIHYHLSLPPSCHVFLPPHYAKMPGIRNWKEERFVLPHGLKEYIPEWWEGKMVGRMGETCGGRNGVRQKQWDREGSGYMAPEVGTQRVQVRSKVDLLSFQVLLPSDPLPPVRPSPPHHCHCLGTKCPNTDGTQMASSLHCMCSVSAQAARHWSHVECGGTPY